MGLSLREERNARDSYFRSIGGSVTIATRSKFR